MRHTKGIFLAVIKDTIRTKIKRYISTFNHQKHVPIKQMKNVMNIYTCQDIFQQFKHIKGQFREIRELEEEIIRVKSKTAGFVKEIELKTNSF